jgi:hypothetical protein
MSQAMKIVGISVLEVGDGVGCWKDLGKDLWGLVGGPRYLGSWGSGQMFFQVYFLVFFSSKSTYLFFHATEKKLFLKMVFFQVKS